METMVLYEIICILDFGYRLLGFSMDIRFVPFLGFG